MVRIASKQPRKQRKARYNATQVQRSAMLGAPLAPVLREKYGGKRTLRVVTGDTVRVLRGNFVGEVGVVDGVDTRTNKIIVHGVFVTKADGTEVPRKVDPSNVQITKLNLKDPRRAAKLGEVA
jgi:large subunit ribosomal protein L24